MDKLSIVVGENRPELQLEETLDHIFLETVKNYPNKTALIFNDKSLTYNELNNKATAFAAYLQSKGLKRNDCCLIWYPRSLELHIAILAIIKCGATYVPLDYEMPKDRVLAVLTDSKSNFLISTHPFSSPCILIDTVVCDENLIANYQPSGLMPDDFAYILFTSGSTGKPKGIPITQRNICHLIRSENYLLGVNSSDKVYQGFSVSFDMWCEETWVSYLVGATIWVADAIICKSIDELSTVMLDNKITVLHAVPSLLAIMEDIGLDNLRIINSGGEACNNQVLNKWGNGIRTFYNSYGPTETTVSSTFANLKAGDKITIGKPLANYGLAVVNEQMEPVKIGEQGELIVTGIGVSKGYLNLEKLTAEKFLSKNETLHLLPGKMLYRSGDATYMDENLDIHFVGRIDDQIKLRGYRIELGEIESLLSDQPNVLQAAVALKKDGNNQDQLTGYVVLKPATSFDEKVLKENLAQKLPPYMVPFAILELKEVPRLPSGKIDRKKLPVPENYKNVAPLAENEIDENDSIATKILKILNTVFVKNDIEPTQDFFTDLGGHSLLAATFVSKIRAEAKISAASLKDIYQHRPLSKLIETWEQTNQKTEAKKTPFNKIPQGRYLLCWFFQSIALLIIFGFLAAEIFIPYLGYYFALLERDSHFVSALVSLGLFCIIPPIFILMGIIVKWTVIGKYKEGEYPLWGTYYFRHWFVSVFQKIVPTQFMNGTPLYPVYLKLMGVKIAPDAQLSSLSINGYDMVTIGADVSVSSNAVFDTISIEDGLLKISKITVGNHAYIGSSSVLGANTVMEDWSELQDLSCLNENQTIPYAEVWEGSPAKLKFKRQESAFTQPIFVSQSKRDLYKIIYSVLLLIFPFFILIPLIPTLIIITELDDKTGFFEFNYLWVTPFLALIYLFLFAYENVILNRWLQKDIKPGTYPIYSAFYVKKWLVDQMNSLSLIVLHPLYATVFISAYFRALGAKVGKKTEISTASDVTHKLLEIGDCSFIADSVTLGEYDVRGQQLILEKTIIGSNSFVGNSALIPQGYQLNDNMLIGVLSIPPDESQVKNNNQCDWFGSPSIAIPKRQINQEFDESQTFNPSKKLVRTRTIIEFLRIIFPQTMILIGSIYFIAYSSELIYNEPVWEILLQLPFYYLFFLAVPALLVTVILKWIIIGKYKPTEAPMWNIKVWKSEMVTAIYEALPVPFFLEYLKGTPWLPLILRLFGVKTGKRVLLNTADFTEYDMISIGDDTAMNDDCGAQTHLFEDRIMKIGCVKIGKRVSVGSRSIILYNTIIEDDVKIDSLSLVMKGEVVQKETSWSGSPIVKK